MLNNYFSEEEIKKLKDNKNLIDKSLSLVVRLFKDKNDKGGIPYSIHLLRVYAGVSTEIEKVCALLHDVIEDTDITYDDLQYLGYPKEVIDILTYLTKIKGEDYNNYIERIISSHNIHVLNIKLADLTHNMEVGRISNPTINDYERINKRYFPAREKVLEAINNLNKEETC